MELTDLDRKLLNAIKNIDNFTIIEIYDTITELENRSVDDTKNVYFISDGNAVNLEIELLNHSIDKYINNGLLSFSANFLPYKKNIEFMNYDGSSIYRDGSTLYNNLKTYSNRRYFKTKDFQYFVSNNYVTKIENDNKKELRRKFWHDWAPLLVSTIALLMTAVPSFINLITKQKQIVVIEYDENILQELEVQKKEIQELKYNMEKLTEIIDDCLVNTSK